VKGRDHWEDIVVVGRMIFTYILQNKCESVDWNSRQALVNTVMNPRFPYKVGISSIAESSLVAH
jgi:hypothetical protein